MVSENCTYLFVVLRGDSRWLPPSLIVVYFLPVRERIGEHDEASHQSKMATIMVVSRARKDKNCEHTFLCFEEIQAFTSSIIFFLREVSPSSSIATVGKGGLVECWGIYSSSWRMRMRICLSDGSSQ